MKLYKPFAVSLFLFLLFPNPLAATTRYVSLTGAHAVPFTSWADAATNIQSAIDAAVDGDTIWVTNGVYSTGGKVMAGDLTNRVALDKALTVRSVNGPQGTVLTGAGATNGVAAVRCAWLTNGAVLQGFTLEAGATRTSGDNVTLLRGGGVWCASSNASVFNCVIRSNAANNFGGGAYQGKLVNCLISTNRTTAGSGGAACDVILVNCTVVSNGNYGVYQTAPNLLKITNSIVYFNAPANLPGGVSCHNSCTTPLPTGLPTGSGNFTNQPGFFLDALHLTSASPCRSAGLSVASGTDIFGNAWATPPSIGCAEWQASPFIPVPRVELTGDPVGFTVSVSAVGGEEPFSFQWLKDGMPLQNDGHFSGTETIGLTAIGIHPTDFGSYQLVASNSSGAVTSEVAQVVFRYANVANINPVPPYSTWATAATTIQDAIDAAVAGEIVLVANGLYGSGGKSMDGAITNRIAMDKAIIVQSVGGPSTAAIQGAWDTVSTNGPGAIRCAWLTNGAVLSGFTLFGGGTRAVTSSPNQQMNGGGVWGSSTNSIVNNCVITTNMASYAGGGVYQATVLNSTLAGNCAVGSGIPGSGVAGAGAGGGAANCNLRNCFLSENVARQTDGGGALNSNLRNCALTKNSSYMNGGAARGGTMVNCTVSGNISSGYSNNYGGAVASATVTNSILWANLSRTSFPGPNYANSTLAYTCSEPLSAGPGNFTADPKLLLDGIHTAETSPCIGAGIASVVGADIDGQTWNNPPSIGCDEWHPQSLVIGQPQSSLITKTPIGLRLGNVAAAGAEPFTFFWLKDGTILNEGSHFSSTGSTNLIVNNFGPSDAGQYSMVASNAFGISTSAVVQVTVHCADAAGAGPVMPYTSWATAATNIQDAIDAAEAGAFVLVTNGVYSTGGKIMEGDLLNRIAIDKPLMVASINGYGSTIIQGAWDPATTNGPLAVRCAWLTNGATLVGFTLEGGATRAIGNTTTLQSGGGIWCSDWFVSSVIGCNVRRNAAAYAGGGVCGGALSNSVLSENRSVYGGGFAYAAAYNSLVISNSADSQGGGAYTRYPVVNCTVVRNWSGFQGGGIADFSQSYEPAVRNCVVSGNESMTAFFNQDYYPAYSGKTLNSCVQYPVQSAQWGNINADPQFTDDFHLAVTSPCRGAGKFLYAGGTDLDGEPWSNPPSMGCDEVDEAAITGPLSVTFSNWFGISEAVAGKMMGLNGFVTGRATRVGWDFGDGSSLTNFSALGLSHTWTNPGDYNVTFTAFNADHPNGVSASAVVHVVPLVAPSLGFGIAESSANLTFSTQPGLTYVLESTTNLAPAVWQSRGYYFATNNAMEIQSPLTIDPTVFFRIRVY